ncbi:MAG: DNA primase catalytic subunit PriS [Candidatus Methanoperedens sp.]|jgi:DNA primase small subunit|nr:DNA primase catalytic subunit PriS [Candidatus Methanoperedens sp.]PKL52893.1 MAG: DNA primase catalytic subunit PriS [Candidatus Methanoperedenaceae archaeon HGW-Methanoperedenaceae-1]
MNFRTKNYLRKRFQDYYNNSDLTMPHDFIRREWGFILFDQMPEIVMRRHKAFSSAGEAVEYIRGMVPAHVYHSAAYYEYPGAGTMKEKKWQGADLIFDLDADHLPQKARSYAEMLANVKAETMKLLDFLLDDFGFTEDVISIVFSGGRGYHIHVRDPKVLLLESAERREIVDYVGGTGLKTEFLFKSEKHKVYDTGKFKKKELDTPRRIISFEDGGEGFGWGKRISNYIIHFLKDISNNDEVYGINKTIHLIKNYKKSQIQKIPDNIVKRIIQMQKDNMGFEQIANEIGMPKEKVRDILIVNDLWDIRRETIGKLKGMKKIAQSAEGLEMIEKGIIDFPYVTYMFDAIVYDAIEENSVHLGGSHTDEPVTADIKRLIRMPLSLHGGSGMKVVPLTIPEFKKFEPLKDAVVFEDREIEIDVLPPLKPQNSKVEMKGKSFTVSEGINTLPEYAAIYLMCRGAAEYA